MPEPVAGSPEVLGSIHYLRAAGVSLVVDCRGTTLPRVVHWGADLGELDNDELDTLGLTSVPPVFSNNIDVPVVPTVLPEHARGWPGLPGLSGHREGRDWSPLFSISSVDVRKGADGDGGVLSVAAEDNVAALGLRLELEMLPSGLVRLRATVRNQHPDQVYVVDGLVLALPAPVDATELLDLAGRHNRERSPQRQPFTVGARVRDSRRGRTGADATLILTAGTSGFGFRTGEVWGVHVAWSGNHRTYAERLHLGRAVLGGGELLLPGEVRLLPGEEYTGPWLYASYGRGLDDLSARFHEYLRSRPTHPTRVRPRPVVLNTWEAVYFDHNLHRLKELADIAASIGVERFVLDDGWFRRRRDDHAGLGDWYVDEEVWPKGLHPLADHVRNLGMEFGLWVEPEMVNPDSDLARAHPDWILSTGGRQPPLSRHQQVLNLGRKEAYAYVLELLDGLLNEYDIGYLKWDHNRDLVDAGQWPGGEAGVHAQTLAVYQMMDELKARHPGLEIESCASGGARVDLGIIERTDRIWASDCNDALERQSIQRWTELLLPPELVGAHVGPTHAHTTGRTHDLAFRAGTALFGHFGIEWDIATASQQEIADLSRWIFVYKQLRHLLHSGTVVRADHPDAALWVHGVVASDASEALFALVSMTTTVTGPSGQARLPGLDPDTAYRVTPQAPADTVPTLDQVPTPWLKAPGITATGRMLGEAGLQVPSQFPESLLLLHLMKVS
jgi:alpha-galactosidase